ncbi:DUF4870 domain-containing protein [Leptospira kanakyensis]|uniref:DUF4870 domain-containing protein n=1 Tax=Leptospira kanakyensis TaxID=2484968 RepID=A0A6N4QDL1_9LEPT|nr:DUF4870 domain-containing protein [Leptospira kanakyensis]TGK50149.1 DUF4870 domain-containing protein [Leptospira kanakyensis]TGK64250.1 DUF4870 domain-containing protein [Leptospira kanakyensis]TGK69287.1 DUF4870 domain-containing protein [Leptospira kanakyensis]
MTEVQLEQNVEEKKWARRAHLSTILTYPMALLPFPFFISSLGAMVYPFVMWLSRNKSSYSAKQSLEAMYLQAILSSVIFGIRVKFGNVDGLSTSERFMPVICYILMAFLHVVFLAIAIYRTTIGKAHHYPFSFFPLLFSSNQTKENWNELKKKFEDKVEFTEYKSQMERLDGFRLSTEKESKSLTDPSLQGLCNEYLHSLSDLRVNLAEDPLSYRKAKQFLNYFPETVSKILGQYNKLSVGSPDAEKRKTELNSLLSEVIKTTEQVRNKLKADETLNLDVEITAMKKNIEFGGY